MDAGERRHSHALHLARQSLISMRTPGMRSACAHVSMAWMCAGVEASPAPCSSPPGGGLSTPSVCSIYARARAPRSAINASDAARPAASAGCTPVILMVLSPSSVIAPSSEPESDDSVLVSRNFARQESSSSPSRHPSSQRERSDQMGAALLGSRQPRAIWLYLGICLAGLSRSASSTTVPGLGCRSAGVQRRVFPRLSLRGGRERPAAARPRVSDVVSAERETTKVAGGKDEKAMQAMVFPVLLRGLVGLQEQDVRDLLEDCGAPVAVRFAGRASSSKRKAIVFFGDRAEARRAHKINGCVVADGAVRSSLLPPVPREEVTAVSAAVGKAGECVPRWRGSPTVECPMAVEGARACAQTRHLTGMHVPVSGCSEFRVSGFGSGFWV